MLARLPSQGFHSYVSFYACFGRPLSVPQARSLSIYRGPCLRHVSTRRILSDLYSSGHQPTGQRAFHASSSRSAPKDPYQVLGVKRDATPAELKKVYFALVRKVHPDTNPDKDAREKFQEIQEAYEILKDEKTRKLYDEFGAASQQPGFNADAFEQAKRNPFGGSGFGFDSFSSAFGGRATGGHADVFETLFGAFGGPRRRGSGFQQTRGADIEESIGLTFLEACKGATRDVPITPVSDCTQCKGSGMRTGASRVTCGSCGGTGTRTFVIENGFQMASTCGTCSGTGSTIPRGAQCGSCSGVGKVKVKSSVKVEIPPGIEDGMTVRLHGKGDAPVDGPGSRGDLIVRVSVAPSKQFRRQGVNLYHEARIPLQTALLGGRTRVPTLDDPVDVRVPAGTQQGEKMVIRGRGVQSALDGKGDLFVEFHVQLPRSLTDRQRAILQEYADDVEGRTSTSTPSASANEGKSDGEEQNGTASFSPDPPSPSPTAAGRLSFWQKLKRLIGF